MVLNNKNVINRVILCKILFIIVGGGGGGSGGGVGGRWGKKMKN